MESAAVSLINVKENAIPTRGILEHFLLEGNKVITVKSDMPEINIFKLVLNSSAVAPNSPLLKVLLLE